MKIYNRNCKLLLVMCSSISAYVDAHTDTSSTQACAFVCVCVSVWVHIYIVYADAYKYWMEGVSLLFCRYVRKACVHIQIYA